MPTNRPMLARVASRESLDMAWQRVRAKRAHGGLDRVSVDDFASHATDHLDRLRRELLEEHYAPEPVYRIEIAKESKPGERRAIGLATVQDKIVQESVRAALEPKAERRFLDCSYGYRPGRGAVRAIGRVRHHLTSLKHQWIASADIDNFFGSIDHLLLLDQVRSLGADEAIVRLVHLWLEMGAIDTRGRWHDVREGVSQGSVISPLLANLYLHSFDQSMVGRKHALIRYADDFIITARDRSGAEKALADARTFLGAKLKLRLNDDANPVACLEDGCTFLGLRFTTAGASITQSKLDSARRKTNRLVHGSGHSVTQDVRQLSELVAGWKRYYGVVLPAAGLAPLADLAKEAAAGLLKKHVRLRTLKNCPDVERAMGHVEILGIANQAERRAWIVDVARRALSVSDTMVDGEVKSAPAIEPDAKAAEKADGTNAPIETKTTQPSAQVNAPPNEAPATKTAPPTNTAPARVETVVRRRKRRHLRQEAMRTELVVDTPGSFLGRSGDRLVVRRDRRVVSDMPVMRVGGVTLAAHGVSLSTDALVSCAERGIPVIIVSGDGRTVALAGPETPRSGEATSRQVRAAEQSSVGFALARRFVEGKIRNQASLIKSFCKYGRRSTDLEGVTAYLSSIEPWRKELFTISLNDAPDLIRGRVMAVEGRAAQMYWTVVKSLLRSRHAFPGRERQGATDLVNVMLNYGYGVLQRRVIQALIKAGLNAAVSFLHAPRRNEPTLAFDLMEEFRAPVVDRVVFTMLARREPVAVDADGRLVDEGRRRLLARVHERLATLVPSRGKQLTLAEILDRQARSIAEHLEGTGKYRPFAARW